MPAYLSAIIFEQKTSAYLEKCESDYGNNDDGEISPVHTVGDLQNMVIELQGVDDGHYLLMVEMNFAREAVGVLTLLKAGDKNEIVMRKSIDLQPIIDSELADHEEFDELTELPELSDDDESIPEDSDLSEAIMRMVSEKRSEYLEGMLAPCLTGNTAFNVKLLDVLDFMVYPLIRNGITGIDPEYVRTDPEVKTPNKQRYTLN